MGKLSFVAMAFWCLAHAFEANAKLATVTDAQARKYIAKKLELLSNDFDMQERSMSVGRPGNSFQTNNNDNNPRLSNTTFHSNAWEYCMNWVGNGLCKEWLHPYISLHGASPADRSPLEGEAYAAYLENKSNNARQGGANGSGKVDVSIWQIEAGGGSVFKNDGTLDRARITDWQMKQNVRQRVERIGTETANRQIARSYENPGDMKNGVMPNLESLRLMAGHFTQMLRNHLVASIGEIRAMQPGIEVALNEDYAQCQNYITAVRNNPPRFGGQQRIDPQNRLDPRTNQSLDERVKRCQEIRNMSAYAVNPQVRGGKVQAGPKEGEWYDAAVNRMMLAAIDYAGYDPRNMPVDERIKVKDDDIRSDIGVYEAGGKNMKNFRMTNWEQIQTYNKALDSAAAGYKSAAARSTFVVDRGGDVIKHKIAMGSTSLVSLNGLTDYNKKELNGTGHPLARETGNDPAQNLVVQPSQLVVRSAQQ